MPKNMIRAESLKPNHRFAGHGALGLVEKVAPSVFPGSVDIRFRIANSSGMMFGSTTRTFDAHSIFEVF